MKDLAAEAVDRGPRRAGRSPCGQTKPDVLFTTTVKVTVQGAINGHWSGPRNEATRRTMTLQKPGYGPKGPHSGFWEYRGKASGCCRLYPCIYPWGARGARKPPAARRAGPRLM